MKGDGDAIVLILISDSLRRWMVSGPELRCVIIEFENELELASRLGKLVQHHKHSTNIQIRFARHVSNLVKAAEDIGSPFVGESGEL